MIRDFINRITNRFTGSPTQRLSKATIDSDAIAGYNQIRKPLARGSFCYAPGTNMLFSQDGQVRVCCHNMEFIMGKYPQQSLKQMWHGDAAQQMRQHMKNFDLSHGCNVCEMDIKMRSYGETKSLHFDTLPFNPEYPVMMEFLMTNTCNLECVMCTGEYSSLIRKNREGLPPVISPYGKEFLQQLEEFIPHLREVRFSGSGEAFAIDINYDIWEMIIRLNPGCLITIQTNGTFLNARIKDFLARGNFRIGVSLDSLHKETFESIRIHAGFDRVMENIAWFSNYCNSKNETFALALCVMRQNWRELPAFIAFCNGQNAMATLHKVWYPQKFALHNLPETDLKEIYDYLAAQQLPASTPLQKQNSNHYHYFVQVIKGWMNEAAHSDENTSPLDKMDDDALFEYLETRISNYLNTTGKTGTDKAIILKNCIGKIKTGFEKYENPAERSAALKRACVVPVNVMVDSLEKYPVEYLVLQSKA